MATTETMTAAEHKEYLDKRVKDDLRAVLQLWAVMGLVAIIGAVAFRAAFAAMGLM